MKATNDLPDVFERMARRVLASENSLVYRWDAVTPAKRALVFPNQCESGFEVRAEAKTYGLYAFAEGWHSAAWEVNAPGRSLEEMASDFLGFLRTLLATTLPVVMKSLCVPASLR